MTLPSRQRSVRFAAHPPSATSMFARLIGATCLLLMAGCASTARTSSDTRIYDATLSEAVDAVAETLDQMRMEIDSASPPGTYPFVIIASFTTDSIRSGHVGSNSRKRTLTITMRQASGGGVQVQVQSASTSNYMSATPSETQTRFLTHLDRRFGG